MADGVPELSKDSAHALKSTWSGIRSFFSFFACLAIVPIYLFYFLSSRRDQLADLAGQLSFLKPDIRNDLVYLIRQFADILEGFFRGQILIGFMMGVGYAIGFSVAGLKFGIALGLLFGVLNIVPFLGTILGFYPYLQYLTCKRVGLGKRAMGCDVGMWCYLLVVQLLESYWLSPRVMGERTGLPGGIIASVF